MLTMKPLDGFLAIPGTLLDRTKSIGNRNQQEILLSNANPGKPGRRHFVSLAVCSLQAMHKHPTCRERCQCILLVKKLNLSLLQLC